MSHTQVNAEDLSSLVDQPPVRPMTVLVVDDTLIGRATVSALVRRLGYRCIEASDGAAALQAFRSVRPDIVLMDVVMPGMDGLQATRELRRLCAGTWLPILLLSARSDDEDMIAGLEAGADDYLSKPIRRAILAAKLAACARQLALQADMNNYRAEQEAEIEFARGVIERQVKGKAVADSRVRFSVIPRHCSPVTSLPCRARTPVRCTRCWPMPPATGWRRRSVCCRCCRSFSAWQPRTCRSA